MNPGAERYFFWSSTRTGIKLNLAAGLNDIPGYLSFDRRRQPPEYIDLEAPLPFDTAYADEILLEHVLEHIVNYQGLLVECRRVLKAEGVLRLRVPDPLAIVLQRTLNLITDEEMSLWLTATPAEGLHANQFTLARLERDLRAAGFTTVQAVEYDRALFEYYDWDLRIEAA